MSRAEDEYYWIRWRMFRSGIYEKQMQLALGDPRGIAMAMRSLRAGTQEQTMDLFEFVFAGATSAYCTPALALDVLDQLDAGWLFIALRSALKNRFDRTGADAEDYRRVAEVLRALDQSFHLNELLGRAEQSTDPLIRRVANDFRAAP